MKRTMKKALIFCLTALFAHQAVASDSLYSWYNPWSYLSGAGSWAKEHKALTALGLAGLYTLYRLILLQQLQQENANRIQQADQFIDKIIDNFLPAQEIRSDKNIQQFNQFVQDELRIFINKIPEKYSSRKMRFIGIPEYNPLRAAVRKTNISQYGRAKKDQPATNRPEEVVIRLTNALAIYASPEKIKDFQSALLDKLEEIRSDNLVRINSWLNEFNIRTLGQNRDQTPLLPEYNFHNPINCNTETCSGIINQMRNALNILSSGKSIKSARRGREQ